MWVCHIFIFHMTTAKLFGSWSDCINLNYLKHTVWGLPLKDCNLNFYSAMQTSCATTYSFCCMLPGKWKIGAENTWCVETRANIDVYCTYNRARKSILVQPPLFFNRAWICLANSYFGVTLLVQKVKLEKRTKYCLKAVRHKEWIENDWEIS